MRTIGRDVAHELAVWTLLAAAVWAASAGLRAAREAFSRNEHARASRVDPVEAAWSVDRWRMHAAARAILEDERS